MYIGTVTSSIGIMVAVKASESSPIAVCHAILTMKWFLQLTNVQSVIAFWTIYNKVMVSVGVFVAIFILQLNA